MPDLADRAQFEASIAAELAPVFAAEYERAVESPGASIVPYAQFQADLQRTMQAELLAVFSAAAAALSIGQALFLSAGAFEQTGRQWAATVSRELSSQVVESSRRMTADAFTLTRGDRQRLSDVLSLIYLAPSRLHAIAVTETTRAVSAGERAVVIPFNNDIRRGGHDDDPRLLVPIWRIDPRSNVCEICESINGRANDVWGRVYPGGPPGHVHCACYLDYVTMGEYERMTGGNGSDIWRRAA